MPFVLKCSALLSSKTTFCILLPVYLQEPLFSPFTFHSSFIWPLDILILFLHTQGMYSSITLLYSSQNDLNLFSFSIHFLFVYELSQELPIAMLTFCHACLASCALQQAIPVLEDQSTIRDLSRISEQI